MNKNKLLIVSNFKSYFLLETLNPFINKLNSLEFDKTLLEIVLSPSFIHIPLCKSELSPNVLLCSQNCSVHEQGDYTGEVSASQLKDLGLDWVLIGQHERRRIFQENNSFIAEKVKRAQESGINVILCLGENYLEKNAGFTLDVIMKQVKDIIGAVSHWNQIIFAYEPVWSFESGRTVAAEEVAEVRNFTYGLLNASVGPENSRKVRFIYGAPVSAPSDFLQACNIDGFLVSDNSLLPSIITSLSSANPSSP